MHHRIAARVSAVVSAVVLGLFISAGGAFAAPPMPEPTGPRSGGGSPSGGSGGSVPFEVFGVAWPMALAIVVGLVALVGLGYSLNWRRHHHQPA